MTLTVEPANKQDEKQTNNLSLVSADRDVDQQVASIIPTTTGQIEDRQQEQEEEEDKFDPATARFAPYTPSYREIDDFMMRYSQLLYQKGGQHLADHSNELINTPVIDYYVKDRDGNVIKESPIKNQKNHYFDNHQAFTNALRRDYMKIRGGDFPLRPGSDKTVKAGQYIATKSYGESSWGEVYWNPDKKRFQYHRTYLEQTGKDATDIGKAIGTALVEFPMTVYGLAYLAHMGLSWGVYGSMSGGEFISGIVAGTLGGGEEAGRDLFKKIIGDSGLTVDELLQEGAGEYEDVRAAYEEFVEPARAFVGQFGPSPDKDVIDRFLEEVFVMGPLALTGAGIVIGMGKKAGMKMARSYGQLALIKQRTGMTSITAMEKEQTRILRDLAAITVPAGRHGDVGRLADASIQSVRKMKPAQRRKVFRENGIPERDIELYEAAQEALSLEVITSSKHAKKIWQSWTEGGIPLPRTLKIDDITGGRMAAKFFMSEVMMAAGFVGAEEYYPDDLFLQMGAGAIGAFWGAFGPTWLLSQGPVGALRKKARVGESNWRTWAYMMSEGFAAVPGLLRPGSRKFWQGMAAEQAIRYFDDWEKYKHLSTELKILKADELVTNSKEFDSMTQQALRGAEWAKGTPKETLVKMERVFRARMTAMARLDEVLTHRGQKKLNRIMQDMMDLPALDFLEKMLLSNVNTSMKFGISSIAMLAELSNIVNFRQQNVRLVQDLIKEMSSLSPESKKMAQGKFFNVITDYRDSLLETLNVSKIRYKDILNDHPVTTIDQLANTKNVRLGNLQRDLDARLGVPAFATSPLARQTYWIRQNQRLDDIFTYNAKKINEAYDAVNFDYVLEGTDEIASTLENIVAMARDLPEYTRTFVGGQPRPASAENLLHLGRQRFLFHEMKDLDLTDRIKYVKNLHQEVSRRIPVKDELAETFWRDPNNEVLSRVDTAEFSENVASFLEAGDIEAASKLVEARVIQLSKISPSSGRPLMGVRFSIKEFSRMRTYVTGKTVTSKGVTKNEYARILKELDMIVGRGEKKLESQVSANKIDQAELDKYYIAKDLYRDHMNLWDVGILRKLLDENEQGQRDFGAIHLDDHGNATSRENATQTIVSEKNFMHNFLLPLWETEPDKMAEAAQSFRNVFQNTNGDIHPLDVDLLLDAFGYEVYRKRLNDDGLSGLKEKQAFEHFIEYFGNILDEADGTKAKDISDPLVTGRVRIFRSSGHLYDDIAKDYTTKKISDAETNRIWDELVLEETNSKARVEYVVDLFMKRRETAIKGSVFHRLAEKQIKTRKDFITEVFGGERGGPADTRFMQTKPPYPRPLPEVAARDLADITSRQPPGSFGIDLMEVQGRLASKTPVDDYKQILDAFRGTEDYEIVKEFLSSMLVDDLVETVWGSSDVKSTLLDFNGSKMNSSGGRETYGSLLTSSRAKVGEFEQYLNDNKEVFKLLLGDENVKILDDILMTTVATEAEGLVSPVTGLLQSYTASGLQSVFWAVARKVISIRFAAGMLGVQAYRIGTTQFFIKIMKDPKGALIIHRALKQKTPLTRSELSAFKEVMTTMFGPHVSSRISEDWAEEQRQKLQGKPQRTETRAERAYRLGRKDVAVSDELRKFQGLQDKQDPIWEMVDTAKSIEYEELINRPTVEEQMSRLGSYDRFPRTS